MKKFKVYLTQIFNDVQVFEAENVEQLKEILNNIDFDLTSKENYIKYDIEEIE